MSTLSSGMPRHTKLEIPYFSNPYTKLPTTNQQVGNAKSNNYLAIKTMMKITNNFGDESMSCPEIKEASSCQNRLFANWICTLLSLGLCSWDKFRSLCLDSCNVC